MPPHVVNARPERLGRYEILEELGRGSMGAVWKARDPQIDRIVALKIILAGHLAPAEHEQFRERFQREAQAAGRMSHPGIVTVYDIAEDETGQPYLVMEYVEGTPLSHLFAPGAERLPLAQALGIATQVARALDYAHRRGVIHRDIKPANILVTRDGRAKIADFGIAKLAGTHLTQTGHLLGTPAFMSPEQFSGSAVDARGDLFSLGAVLYWMCTGEKPFAGDTLTAVSFKIVYTAAIPARQLNPSLPADLETVFERCLAKNPDDRYPSGAALADDLEAIQAGRPIAAQPLAAPALGDTIAPSGTDPSSSRARRSIPQRDSSGRPVGPRNDTVGIGPAQASAAQPPGIGARARRLFQWCGAAFQAGTRATWKLAGSLREGRAAKLRRSKWARAAAFVIVLVLFGVGYWFWPRDEAAAPVPDGTVPQSAPAAGPARSTSRAAPAPAPRSAGRARRPVVQDSDEQTPRPAGATARLRVVCEHNFHSATLEIYADDERVLSAALRGREQDYGVVHVYQGRMETTAPVAAGRHTLRARVSSPNEGYEDEAQITGTFSDGGSRTLFIEFGKGSALGVVERHLTLAWR